MRLLFLLLDSTGSIRLYNSHWHNLQLNVKHHQFWDHSPQPEKGWNTPKCISCIDLGSCSFVKDKRNGISTAAVMQTPHLSFMVRKKLNPKGKGSWFTGRYPPYSFTPWTLEGNFVCDFWYERKPVFCFHDNCLHEYIFYHSYCGENISSLLPANVAGVWGWHKRKENMASDKRWGNICTYTVSHVSLISSGLA